MTVIIFCKATITELVLGKQRNGKANKKKAACASQRKYFCGKEISHHRVLIICLLFSPQTRVIARTGVCLRCCVRAPSVPLGYCCKQCRGQVFRHTCSRWLSRLPHAGTLVGCLPKTAGGTQQGFTKAELRLNSF